jgi:hypothetical protein
VGAVEAKKFPLFSEWKLARCAECAAPDLKSGKQLEAALPNREAARAGALPRKSEALGKTFWTFSDVAAKLQQELLAFLVASNGDWKQAPAHLTPLLEKIGNGMQLNAAL